MKWDEVREAYPNQWVKLRIIHTHQQEDYLHIDEMEFIKEIQNEREATLELTQSRGDSIVYHTSHELIKTKLIKNVGLFRRMLH